MAFVVETLTFDKKKEKLLSILRATNFLYAQSSKKKNVYVLRLL